MIFVTDVGFSHTKYGKPDLTGHRLLTGSFSSAIAKPQSSSAYVDGEDQKIYAFEGGKYVVGDDAYYPGADHIYSRSEDWLMKYLPLLITAAADRSGVRLSDISVLSIGLPINSTSMETKKRAHDLIRAAHINGQPILNDNASLHIHCQAAGAISCYVKESGNGKGNGLCIDLGGNTLLTMFYKNGKALGTGAGQWDELGLMDVATNLAKILPTTSKISGVVISPMKAQQAMITKTYRNVSISEKVDELMTSHLNVVKNKIVNEYNRAVEDLDHIILAGGGAELVFDYLPEDWKGIAKVLPEPQFANVRGYFYLSQAMIAAGK